MNKRWADLNNAIHVQLKRESTFLGGIETLLTLRQSLMDELSNMKCELSREDFNAMPYPNAKGYHSKTIAYSIWHVFRIEDIIAHSLIQNDSEVFETYRDGIGAPIITTGNELVGQEIRSFSKKLDLDVLYDYAVAVKTSTDNLLNLLSYHDLSRKFGGADKTRLQRLEVVSTDGHACWLVDYWCGKDIRGLIQMPFSRHWIMHIEASLRIKNRIHPK